MTKRGEKYRQCYPSWHCIALVVSNLDFVMIKDELTRKKSFQSNWLPMVIIALLILKLKYDTDAAEYYFPHK